MSKSITCRIRCALFLGVALLGLNGTNINAAGVDRLRVEYMSQPLGIDETKPRFSWEMVDSRRGAAQTSYQLQVGKDEAALKEGKADAWDTNEVKTSATYHVEYAGAPLEPKTRYHWRVKVWDHEGKPGEWSEPSWFETAMLVKADWKAKWIGIPYQEVNAETIADGVNYVWYPGENAIKGAPAGTRIFRRLVKIDDPALVKEAKVWTLGDNRYATYVNGTQVQNAQGWQTINSVKIDGKLLKAGDNVIAVSVTNENQSPACMATSLVITKTDGTSETIKTDDKWTVLNVDEENWTTATEMKKDWKAAEVLGPLGIKPWNSPVPNTIGGPASYLRKDFEVTKPIASARLYITSMGWFRAYVNGKPAGDAVLAPEWTDYRKRILYQTIDVTDLVKSGENAVGVAVGDGWYASALGWEMRRWSHGEAPLKLLAQLEVRHADGTVTVVPTDTSWKGSEGAIRRAELYAGETYDARLEQAGWNNHGFKPATTWQDTTEQNVSTTLPVTAQMSPTIRIVDTVKSKEITEPTPGVYVFDLGQNMVGWAKMKVTAEAGTQIKLRFAEILQQDGKIYTDNLRRAECTEVYTCKGGGEEVYEPHFTYHGFRFVEVTGLKQKPTLDFIEGQVVYSAVPDLGTFNSSSELVNQIYTNTRWGLKGNLVSVPTDCPQRDERLGWMGDAQAIWLTGCLNFDMAAFTRKWMDDVIDGQSATGGFGNVSPRIIAEDDAAPAWGDAGIIVPYVSWKQYGDKRLISESWDAMEKWMGFIHDVNPNFIWEKRRGNDYGDWVPADSETDKELIATAYWGYDAKLMAEMAAALGKPEDEKKYNDLFSKISAAFQKKYVKEDGKIANGSQTCYVLPLQFGLLTDAQRVVAAKHLKDDIEARKNHLSTGFLGSTYLMPVLSDTGQHEKATTLLLNETYPSWGYMIRKGATTIWERWNGDKGDPAMNSYNHYCYGAVTDWMYYYVAGLRPTSTGYDTMLFEPRLDGRLTHANAELNTPHGRARIDWKRHEGKLTMEVIVPANVTAKVNVPSKDATVTESGKSLAEAGLKTTDAPKGYVGIDVGAGRYIFETADPVGTE